MKIEDPRYLYWADRLGLVVWEDMPSAYRFTRTAIKRKVRDRQRLLAVDQPAGPLNTSLNQVQNSADLRTHERLGPSLLSRRHLDVRS